MRIFISWSGDRSKSVAEALSTWLEQVVQAVEPWLSIDIGKGARWSPEISEKLETSKVGIICLSPENVAAPWLLFEAGALSKTKDANVCTFLLGLSPAEVPQPLGQFQHTMADKEDVRKLIQTINSRIGDSGGKKLSEKALNNVFETYWPSLVNQLSQIAAREADSATNQRTEREMLEEVLELLRAQDRSRDTLDFLLQNHSAPTRINFGTPVATSLSPLDSQGGLLAQLSEKFDIQRKDPSSKQ